MSEYCSWSDMSASSNTATYRVTHHRRVRSLPVDGDTVRLRPTEDSLLAARPGAQDDEELVLGLRRTTSRLETEVRETGVRVGLGAELLEPGRNVGAFVVVEVLPHDRVPEDRCGLL